MLMTKKRMVMRRLIPDVDDKERIVMRRLIPVVDDQGEDGDEEVDTRC